MGMGLNGGLQGGSSRSGRGYRPMAEINVTPLVDVILVLLIIFMVAAPLLTVGVAVDLPDSEAAPITQAEEPLVISLAADGRIFIQETEVPEAALVARLRAITAQAPDTPVYIRGDRALDYGRVMRVMGQLSGAGFTQLSLITEPAGD